MFGLALVGSMLRLFHASQDSTIQTFHPRPSTVAPEAGPIVWAIAESHLPNYLLPRDCPRVTFGLCESTSDVDRRRFGVHAAGRVVVIESAWLSRVLACVLYLYELPFDGFEAWDESAGYWVSRQAVMPLGVTVVDDLPSAITERGGELRVVHRLWALHDAVAESTLQFSMIRMRNALR
jgi:hypothetical protein